MIFYPDKFRKIRQLKKLSMQRVANTAEIDRTTLWAWEKGKRSPSEANIRILAKILDVNVDLISDLQPLKEKVFKDFSKPAQALLKISEHNKEKRTKILQTFYQQIKLIDNELSNASTIINALISSFDIAFYIKDVNQKYIITNKAFLKMLKKNSNIEVAGKEDNFFFPSKEAAKNKEQDSTVIATGMSIDNQEAPIPGTRKQRWGLITKTPILDNTEKIVGLIGIFVDITKRKKEEETRILLENVLEQIKCGIWICEIPDWNKGEYKFRYINNALENWMGCKKSELYEDSQVWLKNIKSEFLSDTRPNLLQDMQYPAKYEYTAELLKSHKKFNINERVFRSDNNFLFGLVDDNTVVNNLTKENQKLRYLTDNITEDVIWYGHLKEDNSLKLEYINNTIYKIAGVTPKELKDDIKLWFNLIHPEDKHKYIEWDLKDNITKKVEFRIISKNVKRVKWLKETIYKNNNIIYGIIKDITEEVNSKSILMENEKRFKDISFSLQGWLWEMDENYIFTYCSENVLEILGYTKEEVIGKSAFYFMTKQEKLRIKKEIEPYLSQQKPIKSLRSWHITKTGKRIRLLTSCTPFFDNNGNFKGYRGVDREITARVKLEEKLNIFSDAINSCPNALCITDLDYNFIHFNPAFEKMSKFKLGDLKSSKITDIINSNTNEQIVERISEVIKGKKGWSGQVIIQTKSTKKFEKIITISLVKDKTGNSTAIIYLFSDIPENGLINNII